MFSLVAPTLLLCLSLPHALAYGGRSDKYQRFRQNRPSFKDIWNFRKVCPEISASCNVSVVGDLTNRMIINGNINDGNPLDGFVDTQNIIDDLEDNYDVDNDGCVTEEEWRNRWVAMNFTTGLADFRYAGLQNSNNADCVGIDIAAFQAFGESIGLNNSLPTFLDSNINATIAFCETDLTLYTSNCDCAQLPEACRGGLSEYPGCVDFINNVIADGNHTGCIFQDQQSLFRQQFLQSPSFDFPSFGRFFGRFRF